jgi:Flp pilus assembly pilin Flp
VDTLLPLADAHTDGGQGPGLRSPNEGDTQTIKKILDYSPGKEKPNTMKTLLRSLWKSEDGQDIVEYAVMLAVILIIIVGTVRLVGSNANTVFSNTASSLQ